MRDRRRLLGDEGEGQAEAYLRRQGYRILGRNVRSPLGELDLIADDGGTLVFVEVKRRRSGAYGGAIEAVDARKRAKLIQLASQYLAQHRLHDRPCRFDVVLIQDDAGSGAAVQHIANAFDVAGDDLRW
ncbi:MAG: YraN family protein [Nitrospira sp.]|nr:YraN family protein [Nitrospira sp.]MBX3341132.1 YraN family protein [Nitrospira sp.]MCW5795635.1 YraN family protein [Nitrospira sp.]